ncbi:hypothetical protein BSKO_01849 [Bryopsis sp. KO-2023]|nr:hypothetical protein BSKO_01849 [Bryopsis sp. KO-2023]
MNWERLRAPYFLSADIPYKDTKETLLRGAPPPGASNTSFVCGWCLSLDHPNHQPRAKSRIPFQHAFINLNSSFKFSRAPWDLNFIERAILTKNPQEPPPCSDVVDCFGKIKRSILDCSSNQPLAIGPIFLDTESPTAIANTQGGIGTSKKQIGGSQISSSAAPGVALHRCITATVCGNQHLLRRFGRRCCIRLTSTLIAQSAVPSSCDASLKLFHFLTSQPFYENYIQSFLPLHLHRNVSLPLHFHFFQLRA